jgi:hypothetical protein
MNLRSNVVTSRYRRWLTALVWAFAATCALIYVATGLVYNLGNTFRVDTLLVDNNATVGGKLSAPTTVYDLASTLALAVNNNNLSIGSRSLIRTTAAGGNTTITGIDSTGRVDGQLVWIQAPTNGSLLFPNESGASLAANRIHVPEDTTGLTWSSTAGGYTLLTYNTGISRWELMAAGTAIFATLDVNGNAVIGGQFNVPIMIVGPPQNTRARGGLPTVNHGSVATGSSDWYGSITGIGANTSIAMTYSGAGFTSRSFCDTSPKSGTQIQNVTTTGAIMTVTCVDSVTAAPENCVDLFYTCTGN